MINKNQFIKVAYQHILYNESKLTNADISRTLTKQKRPLSFYKIM